jgi:hypothetical protein
MAATTRWWPRTSRRTTTRWPRAGSRPRPTRAPRYEQPQAIAEAPASREALEAKATEIGIKFDGRTSDKKLRDLIAATLEA